MKDITIKVGLTLALLTGIESFAWPNYRDMRFSQGVFAYMQTGDLRFFAPYYAHEALQTLPESSIVLWTQRGKEGKLDPDVLLLMAFDKHQVHPNNSALAVSRNGVYVWSELVDRQSYAAPLWGLAKIDTGRPFTEFILRGPIAEIDPNVLVHDIRSASSFRGGRNGTLAEVWRSHRLQLVDAGTRKMPASFVAIRGVQDEVKIFEDCRLTLESLGAAQGNWRDSRTYTPSGDWQFLK